jgi:parvulin-like peptidyl-prolyl isomerase
MDKGEYTDIIETPFGLHIVYIDDITEVDGKKMVRLSQIVVKKQTLADFINEKIKKMNVKIFIPGYKWDAPNAVVIFADENMKIFEQKIQQERILQQQNTQEMKDNADE